MKSEISPLKYFQRCAVFNVQFLYLFLFFLMLLNDVNAGSAKLFIDKGWASLVKDSDVDAIHYFNQAFEIASSENDQENIALSLLDLGICNYSVSYSVGLEYSSRALAAYKKLEQTSPQKAYQGRCKCLQLISTIYSREGKYSEAINLSKEATEGFSKSKDSTGYLGLI